MWVQLCRLQRRPHSDVEWVVVVAGHYQMMVVVGAEVGVAVDDGCDVGLVVDEACCQSGVYSLPVGIVGVAVWG